MIDLTIITAVRNRAAFILRALDSVAASEAVASGRVRHLVIDGASTDGTQDIVMSFRHAELLSAPDDGVYDAWNRGIALADSPHVMMLNSDDTVDPRALDRAVDRLSASRADILVAWADVRDLEGSLVAVYSRAPEDSLPLRTITRGVPAINAMILGRELLGRLGGFDLRWRLAADREFLLRAWLSSPQIEAINEVLYHYVAHPGSMTIGPEADLSYRCEHLAIAQELVLDDAARQIHPELRRWQAVERARDVRDELGRAGPLHAGRLAVRHLRSQPSWPLRFLARK